MKSKKVIFGLLAIAVVGLALRSIPLHSTSVEGCVEKNKTVHKSLIFGSTKSDIEKEAQEFVASSEAYDCNVSTVTYKLFIL